MDGKRNALLFTAAFFLLAFVLLGCTLGMQLSLRAELDALPAAQEAQTTADPAETLASADAPNEASLVLTQTQPAASIAEQPEMTGQTTSRSRTAAVRTETTRRQAATTTEKSTQLSEVLVVNTNSKKIHSPDCSYVRNMKEENRAEISSAQLEEYLANGYSMCAHCEGYVQ